MALKGNWGRKLQKMIAETQKVAKGDFQASTVKVLGDISYDLAQKGAEAGVNPQGRKWKRLKKGGGMPLRGVARRLGLDTQRTGYAIKSREGWLYYHQKGAKRRDTKWRLPVRRILPKKALPKRWAEPMMDAFRDELRKLWRE